MRNSPTLTHLLTVLGSTALLAGCTAEAGDETDSPSTPPAASSAPRASTGETSTSPDGGSHDSASETTDATPDTSPSPPKEPSSKPTDDGPPAMPAVAKENSEEGAEAFALWYVETLNYLYQHPETGILEKYAGPDCKTCQRHIDLVEEGKDTGVVATGNLHKITGSRALPGQGGSTEVTVTFDQEATDFINKNGAVKESVPDEGQLGYIFDLNFQDRWEILTIQYNVNRAPVE
ncbi:hypothetical protein SAMN05445756_0930 [Kytococcus aerolatus]|uniref:DUF6318 domain-containing protein n=1 Tax=Kytococcus aerolatus TaxID=592308 RepID=A0A212TBY8_9MICO|nr:DUF6318 family protein [Kytococcus aerolatus]SNC63558.1 hypothetical protein SAMN05445756_0930 [Kytococcus aerolatus]